MNKYPPYLDLVLEHCPNCAALYTKIWREKNVNDQVFYEKETFNLQETFSWTVLKSLLRNLAKEKVIKFTFSGKDKVAITIIAPKYIERLAC